MREYGAGIAMGWIRETLARFGVEFDTYMHEATLSELGEIEEAIRRLREAGAIYDHEGAVWFRSTDYGDDKDRVVIRSNGIHTYFGADCAYVIDKFRRGFDHLLYVWGADHHGDVVRVKGAAQALGFDPDAAEILIYQFVSFLRGGVPVKMSKRAGEFVTLERPDRRRRHRRRAVPPADVRAGLRDDLRHRRGRAPDHGEPGLLRAVRARPDRQHPPEGGRPRASALRPVGEPRWSCWKSEAELDLMRKVAELPAEMADASRLRAPQRLTRYAEDLAALFHRFYGERTPDGGTCGGW